MFTKSTVATEFGGFLWQHKRAIVFCNSWNTTPTAMNNTQDQQFVLTTLGSTTQTSWCFLCKATNLTTVWRHTARKHVDPRPLVSKHKSKRVQRRAKATASDEAKEIAAGRAFVDVFTDICPACHKRLASKKEDKRKAAQKAEQEARKRWLDSPYWAWEAGGVHQPPPFYGLTNGQYYGVER